MKNKDDENKKIVVLGAGESGVGAALLAKRKNIDVFVSDKGIIQKKYKDVLSHYDIEFEEGRHSQDKILKSSVIIKSPGIPDNIPLLIKASEKGIKIISEVEFAGRYTNAKKICVTGSNGKTTTTLLIHHLLSKAGLNVGLAGNVGKSFAWMVAEEEHDVYVLEISSFQLDGMFDFKADVAVLLNITPDHLDRYNNDFAAYIDSKFRICRNHGPDDAFIFNFDDAVIRRELEKRDIQAKKYPFSIKEPIDGEGAFVEGNKMNINVKSTLLDMTLEELALQGKHNIYNSMAASIAARLLEIRKDFVKQSLSDFQNVEHRLEHVAMVHGIEFINDSKATNINSVWYALESMNKPVIWIAGGVDKGNDYKQLKELVQTKAKAIICLGKDNKKLLKAFKNTVETMVETTSAKEAVELAYYMGKPGDVVLLSPACASFDLFENYEDRGNQFKQAVKEL